jgi:HD-GYP domain-containing protein (c-di-GMP phosphodiesterase class II)
MQEIKKHNKPFQLFVIIIVSVFIIELLIMHYLVELFPFSAFVEGIIDACALALLIFPVVYFFSLHPMELYIDEVRRERETIRENYGRLEKIQKGTIRAMSQIAEMREQIRKGHQQRVSQLATVIGREMGLPEKQIDGIRMAGLIYDIGKMAVPIEILNKPEITSKNELALYMTYPKIGYDLLKDIEFPWPIAKMILQHQERMNGSGYPQGLSGKDILLEARILGVSDIVENMATPRPYRTAIGLDKALEEITKNKDSLYDPDVVDACVRLFKEKGFKFE